MPINNVVTMWLAHRIERYAQMVMDKRGPDVVIGGNDDPYLRRWWIIPRNRVSNAYLHDFRRSDDDRACHDHEYVSLSLALRGDMREVYLERTKTPDGYVVVERTRAIKVGDLVWRRATFAHRMVVVSPGLTLFLTGPRVRAWGFVCPRGWVPWQQFVGDRDSGAVGRGCE